MKRAILLFLISFLFSSCVTNYYYVTLEEDTNIYLSSNDGSNIQTVIPSGDMAYISSKVKKNNYRRIKYKNKYGWAYNPSYRGYAASNYSSYNYTSGTSKKSRSYTKSSGRAKTVSVKGHYRKNGTYVKPYKRSAPRRR